MTDVLHFLSTPVLRPAPGPSPATGQFLSASRKISHFLGWQILYWSASPGRWFASFTRQCTLGICKWGGLSDGDPLWYTQTAAFWWSPGLAALIFWSWSWLCEQVSRLLYTCTLFFTSAGSTPSATPACQVMSCRKVLCLCGKTFPRRLWLLDTHLNGLKLVTKRSRIFQDQISKTPNQKPDPILQFGGCYKPTEFRIHF